MKLSNYLLSVNWQNLHANFFYLFLLSIPFQTRKVFLTPYSFYSGDFTEYGTIFIYASDLFLIATILLWVLFNSGIIYRISNIVQRIREFSFAQDIKNPSRVLRSAMPWKISLKNLEITLLLLGLFNFWLFIELFINPGYFEISFYQSVKIFEFSLLFFYLSLNLNRIENLIMSLKMLVIGGFIQGLIGIIQFLTQHSIFSTNVLHKITGEAIISNNMLGSAKIVFEDEKILRAYGTLPHPNILAGFLVITFFISIYIYLRHRYNFLSSPILSSIHCDTQQRSCQVASYLLWIIIISVQLIALIFTFSRSAWFGLCAATMIFIFFMIFSIKNVSRETFFFKLLTNRLPIKLRNTGLNTSKTLVAIALIISFVILLYFPLISTRLSENLINESSGIPANYAVNDRVFYNNVSRETLSTSLIAGSGLGTSIFQIDRYLQKNVQIERLQYWQYQPDHNAFSLILSEIGLTGFSILMLLTLYLIRNNIYTFRPTQIRNLINLEIVSRETIHNELPFLNVLLLAILVSILIISIFDHYFWTMQQGRILFWLTLGMMAATMTINDRQPH